MECKLYFLPNKDNENKMIPSLVSVSFSYICLIITFMPALFLTPS